MIHTPSRLLIVQIMVIVAAIFWVFSPAFHGDWLWDDSTLIRQNPLIHDPAGLWKIWFEPVRFVEYLPITASVEWIEWHLWRADTLGYHLVSILLHAAGALLVFRLFTKLDLRLAWLGGLLFAIHPTTVESAAWISELKNTLSLPPFLLAMCAWIDFDRRGQRRDYLRSLGLFTVAMFCKSTMIMFPVVILLHAWWRRKRIAWSDLKASGPFFAISFLLGLLEIHLQHRAGTHPAIMVGSLSLVDTLGWEIVLFMFRCLWPVNLLPIYPGGLVTMPSIFDVLPWLMLAPLIVLPWLKRNSWGRHVLLGVGFFLLNLVPVLVFIFMNATIMVWSMDHLTYIPIIGLIGLMVAGCGQIDAKLPSAFRPWGIGAVAIILTLLAVESHGYAGIYLNQETLWTYTLQGDPDSEVAHNNLGLVYLNSGRLPQAIEQFHAALRLKPDYAFAHNGLGNALYLSGQKAEAIDHYREALRIDPDYPEAHNGLANALLQSGHLPEAKAECEKALKLKPDYAEAHCNLGLILAQEGQIPEAIGQFEMALQLNPDDARIQSVLESLRARQNNGPEKK